MMKDWSVTRGDPRASVAVIVAENLMPLIGVLAFGWSVAPVMVVYWLENVIRGLVIAARMTIASGPLPMAKGLAEGGPARAVGKMVVIGFFLAHYGLFCLVHGVFVFVLFLGGGPFGDGPFGAGRPADLPVGGIVLAGVLIAASLVGESARDSLKAGGITGPSIGRLIGGAYARVVVLHVTIIFGGFALMSFGSPTPAVVLLIALKAAGELAFRRWEEKTTVQDQVVS